MLMRRPPDFIVRGPSGDYLHRWYVIQRNRWFNIYAHHHYAVDVDGSENGLDVYFQNGPIAEAGVNGVTQEVLLAIVIDRLRCFQAGPFSCPENADALTHATEALNALKSRTKARMARASPTSNWHTQATS